MDIQVDYPFNILKSFFQVVSNSFCGIDVDKLDYLARDGKTLGVLSLHPSDLERIFLTASVEKRSEKKKKENQGNGDYHIVWRDVTYPSLESVLQIRHRLHWIACKHKATVAVQIMLRDAMTTKAMEEKLKQVRKHLSFTGILHVSFFTFLNSACSSK